MEILKLFYHLKNLYIRTNSKLHTVLIDANLLSVSFINVIKTQILLYAACHNNLENHQVR